MGYESVYDNTGPFTYEITIVKTGGPTKQSFDFAGYDTNASIVTSKTLQTVSITKHPCPFYHKKRE